MSDSAEPWKTKEKMEGGCRITRCLALLPPAWPGWSAGGSRDTGGGLPNDYPLLLSTEGYRMGQ